MLPVERDILSKFCELLTGSSAALYILENEVVREIYSKGYGNIKLN